MEPDTSIFDEASIVYLPTRRKTPLIFVFDPNLPDFEASYDAEQLEIHLRNSLSATTWHILLEMMASRVAAGAVMTAWESLRDQQQEEGDNKPPKRPKRQDPLDPEP